MADTPEAQREEPRMSPPPHDPERFAWAKLNAYGILLALLSLMGLLDLWNPRGTKLAELAGDVPPGQAIWISCFAVAGMLLLAGFIRTDRLAETLGLVLLSVALIAQTTVAYHLLGWSDYTLTRLVVLTIVGVCTWARVSVLWTKKGLTVTIPPRSEAGGQ